MTRLAFRLPEWAPRTIWTSVQAKDVWQTRISTISQTWQAVERLLVEEGVRPSTLQNIAPESLPEAIKAASAKGLVVLPLGRTAKVNGYQSASASFNDSDPWDYRCALTVPNNAGAWATAWASGDNDEIGRLLGYPTCCREFFEQVWVKEHWFDTTWPMVRGEKALSDKSQNTVEVAGINMLWRWHGLRTVSHLPCSFDCPHSIGLGLEAVAVMAKHYPEEASWLKEILSWPVEWTALHGIGELRTPISRTTFATDATGEKLTVKYMGDGYPAEGASGLTFPFRSGIMLPTLRLSNSRDNGFVTHAAMQAAHAKLLAALNPPYNTILDLGCGDGVLLSKIPCKRRIGVEADERVAKLAAKRIDRVVVGDCTDHDWIFKLIEEEKPDLVIAQEVRNPVESIKNVFPNVLSYNYETGHVRLYR